MFQMFGVTGDEEHLFLACCMGDEAEIHMDKHCP